MGMDQSGRPAAARGLRRRQSLAACAAILAGLAGALAPSAALAAFVPPRQPVVPPVAVAPVRPACGPAAPAPGDRWVCSPQELAAVLRAEPAASGRIIIPKDVTWNVTGLQDLPLRSGVQLIGERGDLASRPILFTDARADAAGDGYRLFRLTGNDVRVQGIHFRGPKPYTDRHTEKYVTAITVIEDAEHTLGRRVVIADNEFDLWSGAAVEVAGRHGNQTLATWRTGLPDDPLPWRHLSFTDAGLVRIERNSMHHNVMDNGGYGVEVTGGAYATIEGNVFDTNRHSVASSGRAYSGYVARFNFDLQGGFKQGSSYNQHYDVHGETDSGDNKGYGGNAGTRFEIAFNTILGAQSYAGGFKTRPALMLRGKPTQGMYFHDNVLPHEDADAAVALKMAKGDLGLDEDDSDFNYHGYGNHYGTDHTLEIAAGDFDGDRRTDVFLATGTGWFISRAGIRPWELIHESTKLRRDLGFADIDNDGTTDVLYRDGAGKVGYLKSGRAALRPLTTAPVPMREIRFGDFDGDGLTDLFYTRNRQWHVWYGRTRAWAATQTSTTPIGGLLFGEFDAAKGTDVVAVKDAGWMLSSASTGTYTKLNSRRADSFTNMVTGDFNGNGRTDIAYGGQKQWFVSYDGSAPFTILRDGNIGPNLNALLVGRFDNGKHGAQVAGYSAAANPQYFNGWQGQGSTNGFTRRSEQKMR
ncbi:MAG: VCBS repeat-containing protein [Solirubrobacteraceae bacterium]